MQRNCSTDSPPSSSGLWALVLLLAGGCSAFMDFDQFKGRGLDALALDAGGELDAGDAQSGGTVDGGSALEHDAGLSADASMLEHDAGHDAGKAPSCEEASVFTSAATYAAGDRAQVRETVYVCKADAANLCSGAGYEPGMGFVWQMAWSEVCSSAPPRFCSEASTFNTDQTYYEGARVQVDCVVYVCGPGLASRDCNVDTFEPGTGANWRMAWTIDCASC